MARKKKMAVKMHEILGKSLRDMSDTSASIACLLSVSYAKKSSINRLAKNIFENLIHLRKELDNSLSNDYRDLKFFCQEVNNCYWDFGRFENESIDFLRLPRFNAKGMIGIELSLNSPEFKELILRGITHGFWYISLNGELFKFLVAMDDREWYVKRISSQTACYAGASLEVFNMLVKGEDWIDRYQWDYNYKDDCASEERTDSGTSG